MADSILAPMPPTLFLERVFANWLLQRRIPSHCPSFSIAIESSSSADQPQVSELLADYLNEFDDSSAGNDWLPINDQNLERIQAHQNFRYLIGKEKADDPSASLEFLGAQGFAIFELATCLQGTAACENVFQISLNDKEPEEKQHHLWLNAKRIQTAALIPILGNSFLDWRSHEAHPHS